MDVIGDIAAIRTPLPRPGEVTPEECFDDAREQAEAARAEDAAALEAQCDGLEEDALLLALGNARARREAADREIRHLLAYGREFHGRRAYGLDALAEASGMSISGVRTAYTPHEIDAVARQIGRAPDSRRARPPARADRS
ncbi:hypothetical protein LRS74_00150 [Streptomyces sp. LX-29]|uniref:hypothetical protein n=1 Tax=Streptomyces sp. LX-29 TaxID=2900152 RepID=UPI00240E5D24|nr:hypothetical protein [Streptomyces sp. LX-29]WFB05605.1 hypothetical protein LRS74_00150 [Streptomyces sp. LX-29]